MRNGKMWLVVVIAIVLISLPLIPACSDDDGTEAPKATTESTSEKPTTENETTQPTEEPPDDVVITIGNMTDMTGHAAGVFELINTGLTDLVQYFNDENIIPGVKLEILTYDTGYDPAKDKPGYEWLKERGADLIFTQAPHTPITLKPRADKDQMVIFCTTTSPELLEPPGYVFTLNTEMDNYSATLLKWIAENEWDYQSKGPAEVAAVSYVGPAYENLHAGAEAYCKEHPEQFTWKGSYMQEFGSFDWSNQIDQVKEVDYLLGGTIGVINYAPQLRNQQIDARLLLGNWTTASLGIIVDSAGADYMDGQLFIYPNRWWNEDYQIPNLARELVKRYHGENELEGIMRRGNSYLGAIEQGYGMLSVIKKAVEDYGAENFSSQTLYDAATSFSIAYGGCEEWHYTDTKRTAWEALGIYEFSGEEETLVRKDPEWQPVLEIGAD